MTTKMIEVNRRNLKSIGYSRVNSEFIVKFLNEEVWVYYGVPKDIALAGIKSILQEGSGVSKPSGEFGYRKLTTKLSLCNRCVNRKSFPGCNKKSLFVTSTFGDKDNVVYCEKYIAELTRLISLNGMLYMC